MEQDSMSTVEQAREMGEEIAPVDWYGFSQMKRWDHGILPELRRMAGYEDPLGVGTYTQPTDPRDVSRLDRLVTAFRNGAEGV